MSGPTFIDGDRIDLQPVDEDDIEFLLKGVNHPKVRQYIGVFRRPYSETRYREELWPIDTDDTGVTLLAAPKSGAFEGKPVGSVQLYPLNEADGSANFGVWFHPSVWGDGYALEASAQLIEYGFEQLRLHRISATTMAPNDDARTLCKRLGFVHEGTARDAQFANGGYVDAERFGLLADAWAGVGSVVDNECAVTEE
ncbi:GNAT family N-acetyltransferase [Halocatena halophila]|uniref:GNAT family N-acetyltransferase n=1 Tax=Halocatena halophila TaxID=2814576 RepID=UPI002ED26F70